MLKQSKSIVPLVRVSQKMCGKIEVIDVSESSSHESAEAVINCPSGVNF